VGEFLVSTFINQYAQLWF